MLPAHALHRRLLSRFLSRSLCAAAMPLFAGSPADPAGPLPAGGRVRPLFAANSVPPITPPIADESAATQVLPAAAPAASANDERLMAKADATKAVPSQNVTINLINRLVERGVLPKEDAVTLIQQAESDAVLAREMAAATQAAVDDARAVVSQAGPILGIPPQLPPTPDIAPYGGESAVRVTYIPENVKAEIRDQLKAEVLAQARGERWADPRTLPEWTTRIRLFGDVRTRYEALYFPNGNDNTGAFPNFNAINTGAPFDISGTVFSPQLNVDEDRTRLRLRVRLGAETNLGEGFSAGVRVVTGESNSPTSPNQSLGAAGSGQGGNFSKYAIWLDRGFLKYETGTEAPKPVPEPEPLDDKGGKAVAGSREISAPAAETRNRKVVITLGRFDNPFFASEVIYDDDLGFDGIAGQVKYEVWKNFTPFLTLGAFPVFNTDLNFSTNRPDKFPSTDKWLYAGQLGLDWRPHKDFTVKIGGAYYVFDRIAGQLSDPFTPLTAQDAGNTDTTRPSFAQKGNTYMALRNIVPTADNNFGTSSQFQYFGLVTPFRVLGITGKIDYTRYEPFTLTFFGEYLKNLAFDKNDIEPRAINNRGPNTAAGLPGLYDGGDTAWIAGIRLGHPTLDKRWDWNVAANYRWVESDAVVDGFADSDFGGGGTNVKGYTFGGALALGSRVALGLRWMSSNQIAGPPLKNDTLQVDVSGKF